MMVYHRLALFRKGSECMDTEQQIITAYQKREFTIRELAALFDLSYTTVRKMLVNAGYAHTKFVG